VAWSRAPNPAIKQKLSLFVLEILDEGTLFYEGILRTYYRTERAEVAKYELLIH